MIRFRPLALLSFLLVALSALQNVSVAGVGSSPVSQSNQISEFRSILTTGGSVRSDFDGDSQSDLATVRTDGLTFSLQIQLSSHQEETSLDTRLVELGIHLLACDIDRDNDQDLVLISQDSVIPLAIWLNDSKGNFERNSRWLWLNLNFGNYSKTLDHDSASFPPVSVAENFRLPSPIDQSATDFLTTDAGSHRSLIHQSPFFPSLLLSEQTRLRGPPDSSQLFYYIN